jgi:hypothetical protein
MAKRVIYNHKNINITQYTGWRKSFFRNYISFRWWNKRLVTLTSVGALIHRTITRFLHLKRKASSSDWVGNFVWGSPVVALAPPRENDHGLALNIDTYLTYVDKQINSRS